MGDRVLIITQDDLAAQDELDAVVSNLGYDPVLVDQHHHAPLVLAEQGIALAVLDHGDGNGLETLRQLLQGHPDTQVISLVGPREEEVGAQALESGASDFLVKPVNRACLAACLRRARENLSLRRRLAELQAGIQPAPPPQEEARDTRLLDTQARFEQLFNEVPCYILVVDKQFRLTAVNRRYREDFGDHIGRYCYQIFTHHEQLFPDCPVSHTFGDGKSRQYEEVITAQNGEQYYVLTTTAPIYDSRGEITQVMEMSTNITQIRKLQDHLASLGLLIGSISHGVKGLLTGLDAGIYSLRTGLEKGDQTRVDKGWKLMDLMLGRMRSTVLDILYYAKDRDLCLEEVDVADFARHVAAGGRNLAHRRKVNFELNIGEDLGVFKIDASALNPAIMNLLENAVDACVEEKTRADHRVVFSVAREDDVLVFDIQDDGIGMDESTKEKVFTLFFTSKGSAGTGLGLFIANDTVAEHGGTIAVDSEPGQGSHFHLRIPVRPRLGLPRHQPEDSSKHSV